MGILLLLVLLGALYMLVVGVSFLVGVALVVIKEIFDAIFRK